MKSLGDETMPKRIQGMLRLEEIFNQNGYLVCQSTGKRIYDFEEVVAVFIPLNSTSDQIMAVHRDHAKLFLQSNVSSLHFE